MLALQWLIINKIGLLHSFCVVNDYIDLVTTLYWRILHLTTLCTFRQWPDNGTNDWIADYYQRNQVYRRSYDFSGTTTNFDRRHNNHRNLDISCIANHYYCSNYDANYYHENHNNGRNYEATGITNDYHANDDNRTQHDSICFTKNYDRSHNNQTIYNEINNRFHGNLNSRNNCLTRSDHNNIRCSRYYKFS